LTYDSTFERDPYKIKINHHAIVRLLMHTKTRPNSIFGPRKWSVTADASF